jgi:hypothetical protein
MISGNKNCKQKKNDKKNTIIWLIRKRISYYEEALT